MFENLHCGVCFRLQLSNHGGHGRILVEKYYKCFKIILLQSLKLMIFQLKFLTQHFLTDMCI